MKISVLIVSRNRPDLVQAQLEWLSRSATLPHDVYVVEAGSDRDKIFDPVDHPNVITLRFDDPDFRGKAFAHNIALEEARRAASRRGQRYDYHWVLMNDVVFADGVDAMRTLVETMEREPRLGILSPTCEDGLYPASRPRPTPGWRPVTTCDYLGFMVRGDVVENIGFLNPSFRYCWGAIHELSFLVHSNGLCVGYSDDVTYRHLGGTTYGAQGTNTISREEYQRRAKRFAFTYFNEVYGPDWARDFYERARPFGPEIDTYSAHERMWQEALTPEEIMSIREKGHAAVEVACSLARRESTPAPVAGEGLKLHIGCGELKREGWVNVDVDPSVEPDLVAPAHDLSALPSGSCSVIEACHLFEHLTVTEARAALLEWRRLLGPGGELQLELPNLARCVELLDTEVDGISIGMIGMYGYPPDIDRVGTPMMHKWGWTPDTLAKAMIEAGFDAVDQVPITQTFRAAAQFDRDMRLVAHVAASAQQAEAASLAAPALAEAPASPAEDTEGRSLLPALGEPR